MQQMGASVGITARQRSKNRPSGIKRCVQHCAMFRQAMNGDMKETNGQILEGFTEAVNL